MVMHLTEHQEAWVKALESGRYKQGQDKLRRNDEFCCLGVACDISDVGQWDNEGYYHDDDNDDASESNLTSAVALWLGIPSEDGGLQGNTFMLVGGVLVPHKWNDSIPEEDNPDFEDTLVGFNDSLGATFPQIAAFIRSYPELVFGDDD